MGQHVRKVAETIPFHGSENDVEHIELVGIPDQLEKGQTGPGKIVRQRSSNR